MPTTANGIASMLVAFDTNIAAAPALLNAKYGLTDDDLARVHQARLVWAWYILMLDAAREWAKSLTEERDTMKLGPLSALEDLPGGPLLPAVPLLPGPGALPAKLEPGFFIFFSSLVAKIKKHVNYDIADGTLLGIEGAEITLPDAATTIPPLTGEIFTSGHPELSCVKGVFQGYDVYLTRPGQARKLLGTSLGRRYNVLEPLPAPGVAELWIFEVQFRYHGEPFGQFSAPLGLTVHG